MSMLAQDLNVVAAELYADALALEVRAERCRRTASLLELRRAAVTQRHQPVLALHNDTVWQGRAATASREHLARVTGRSLHHLGEDLATTARALHAEAEGLSDQAAALRRQARQTEAEAARSQQATDNAPKIRSRRPWPIPS